MALAFLPSGRLGGGSYAVNRIAKGGLLHLKRPPFRDQKTVFYKATGNILIIKIL